MIRLAILVFIAALFVTACGKKVPVRPPDTRADIGQAA